MTTRGRPLAGRQDAVQLKAVGGLVIDHPHRPDIGGPHGGINGPDHDGRSTGDIDRPVGSRVVAALGEDDHPAEVLVPGPQANAIVGEGLSRATQARFRKGGNRNWVVSSSS
jgi:hypothetical protein